MNIFSINILWFQIAPTYYGLMYGLSFLIWYFFLKRYGKIEAKYLDDLLLYIFFWVVIWWRLWYILFYDFTYYIQNILDILKVWQGWMSFHWWVLWVVGSMYLFSRKYKIPFLKVADHITLVIPIGLFFWRIWNYINWELLWFSGYTGPLAVYKWATWYFPSPLLEAFLEWLVLFWVLLYVYNSPLNSLKTTQLTPTPSLYKRGEHRFDGQIASLFLVWYWVFRIFVEIFFRQPDSHIGLLFGFISTGTLLSIPMIVVGGFLYFTLSRKK